MEFNKENLLEVFKIYLRNGMSNEIPREKLKDKIKTNLLENTSYYKVKKDYYFTLTTEFKKDDIVKWHVGVRNRQWQELFEIDQYEMQSLSDAYRNYEKEKFMNDFSDVYAELKSGVRNNKIKTILDEN